MIKSFRPKTLKALWETGKSAEVPAELRRRCLNRLTVLNRANNLTEVTGPGFDTHPLKGKPQGYALSVNGPWRITFEFEDGDALRVDLEQYH